MCVEVYSTDQPIQIPYEHENLRFLSPTSFRARYTLLVRNAGFRSLHLLSVLYPRLLYHLDRSQAKTHQRTRLQFGGFTNITERLPLHHREMVPVAGGRLELELPDPNNPLCRLPTLSGYWDHDNSRVEIPEEVWSNPTRSFWVFRDHRFSAWNVRLAEPIRPGTAHWLQWEFEVSGVGEPLHDSLYGPVVFHEVASPIDVRRTVVENLQNALQDVCRERDSIPTTSPDYQQRIARLDRHEEVVDNIAGAFGLGLERRVDIQYYELTLETGDPKKQFLLYAFPQGDIRMRSGSPRLGQHEELDQGRLGEPVYEWKSGSILEPAHPWRNTGFSLRLGLGCQRRFFKTPLKIAH